MAGHLRKFAEEEDCATKRDGLKEKLELGGVKLGKNVWQILKDVLCGSEIVSGEKNRHRGT